VPASVTKERASVVPASVTTEKKGSGESREVTESHAMAHQLAPTGQAVKKMNPLFVSWALSSVRAGLKDGPTASNTRTAAGGAAGPSGHAAKQTLYIFGVAGVAIG
jgi:hypothetical protein